MQMSKNIQVEFIKPGAPAIPYAQSANRITFREELMLDLSKYERDYEVRLDICENRDGILIIGLSDYYVAQLVIAEHQYEKVEAGESGDDGAQHTERRPLPFDISRSKLILWPLNKQDMEVNENA